MATAESFEGHRYEDRHDHALLSLSEFLVIGLDLAFDHSLDHTDRFHLREHVLH